MFTCTFAKVQWNVAGSVFLADLTAGGFLLFYALDRLGRGGRPAPRTAAVLLAFLAAFLLVYLIGFFNLETGQALDQFVQGPDEVAAALRLPDRRRDLPRARSRSTSTGARSPGSSAGSPFNGAYGILQLRRRAGRAQPRLASCSSR